MTEYPLGLRPNPEPKPICSLCGVEWKSTTLMRPDIKIVQFVCGAQVKYRFNEDTGRQERYCKDYKGQRLN